MLAEVGAVRKTGHSTWPIKAAFVGPECRKPDR